MASVSSLDQDMRKLRLDRYTPAAANEVKRWIEDSLGEKLPGGDLMEALKDGVALCKLVNQVTSPGVRFKSSNMPFVQMENISHFLKACELPPLSLPSHDRFLTVDLYDQKDPAQVLQCIAAFSRRANAVKPSAFPTTIGAKSKGGAMSPQGTGNSQTAAPYTMNTPPPKHEPTTAFNSLNRASYSSAEKPSSLGRGGLASGGPVSSWSNQSDESNTAPAWNIHQYGYMGGASQGNQGVAFGARRQITSQAPQVPSLAEKEKRRKEVEDQRQRDEEEDERRRQKTRDAEEARAREDEQRRWQEETRKLKQQQDEEDTRRNEEDARKGQLEKEAHDQQEREAKFVAQRTRQRQVSDSRLNGQFLSQYQSTHGNGTNTDEESRQPSTESQRIAELERQLAEAREAEKKRAEREQTTVPEEQVQKAPQTTKPIVPPREAAPVAERETQASHEDDWDASERDYLKKQWQVQQQIESEDRTPSKSQVYPESSTGTSASTNAFVAGTNRTDRFLASNPAPKEAKPTSHRPADFSTTTEVDLENQRRIASQQKTKAGGWASKSLLEREMERERERQREWEEEQKATATRQRDVNEGSGAGQTWDVHQYGYMGGDSQNRGGPGLGVGGARRQIIGPRPPP